MTLAPLHFVFEPRVVAVVGAGRGRGHVGAEIFHNLVNTGFTGRVIPVNLHAPAVEGVPACATVRDIDVPVDLAVIAVPNPAVEAAVDDCLAMKVPALVVITAGFGETGGEGRAREVALREKVRAAGARLVGPNCLGVLNTDPDVSLNATFSPVFPPPGKIAFSSQSGALGLAVLDYARRLDFGISQFISVGNKADVSTNDLLERWEHDARTSVILLYVESFGNPRRFMDIARRVSRRKPILAVKAGRSSAGARAASSHTGALAARDAVVDALFRAAGVVRTETLEELFDTATLLAHQPVPTGPRVAILTNAGGPGIMGADACEALGLPVPALAPATVAALREFLLPAASVANPVDMVATAPADHYRRSLEVLLADPGIDSVVAIFVPPLVTSGVDAAHAIAAAARGATKPVLTVFFGTAGVAEILAPVPVYVFPEPAVRALANATAYGRSRLTPDSPVPAFADIAVAQAAEIIAARAHVGGGWLPTLACTAVLDAFGIPSVATRVEVDREGVRAAARDLHYPIALKGIGPAILHKSAAGTVHLNLHNDEEVLAAYGLIERVPGITHTIVQPMADRGVEMLVGVIQDPTFGPVVVCGIGGSLVEVLHDTSCRLAPLREADAHDMVHELRGAALLKGAAGLHPADERALYEIILRVSALAEACPEIVEMDLNPVVVGPSGALVLDSRIRVAAVSAESAGAE